MTKQMITVNDSKRGERNTSDSRIERITVVSFYYGRPYAEGICTSRLVEALQSNGTTVNVISCSLGTAEPRKEAEYLPSLTMRCSRIQQWLGSIANVAVPNWDWVIRVSRRTADSEVIYARYWPAASLVAGKLLAERMRLPLAIHFSDPFPNPWYEDPRRLRRRGAVVRDVLRFARLVTFSTEEARDYMLELYSGELEEKTHIVRNIVPEWVTRFSGTQRDKWTVTYIGQFYGPRTPEVLLEGMRAANRLAGKNAYCLRLVGTDPSMAAVCRRIAGDGLEVAAVPSSPRVSDEYAAADIVVVVDANVGRALFLATKAGEAVHCAPRALFITPLGSPARKCFDRGLRSLSFCQPNPNLVAEALQRLAAVDYSTAMREIPMRRVLLEEFRAANVAASLSHRLASLTPAR